MKFTYYAFLMYMVYVINVYEFEGGGHTPKSLPKQSLFPSSSFPSLTLDIRHTLSILLDKVWKPRKRKARSLAPSLFVHNWIFIIIDKLLIIIDYV